jgi:DNA-binding GntR family transcriptional regulator
MRDKIPEKYKISDDTFKEMFPRRLVKTDLYERVYSKLKNMILSGRLMKGQRLVEEKLAHRLNVSRNPVQIALLRLRKEKLLVWKYKKGTFVA